MIEDFYPTPETLIYKLLGNIKINELGAVLDLGAGKGDISDYIQSRAGHHRSENIVDCIELNPELQMILRGKGHRVIHDDILTFRTYKRYDLFVANFPFSIGDKCLLKALQLMEETGGRGRFIVNAETIRNPYTNLRRALVNLIDDLCGEVEYFSREFNYSERFTNVEIAIVKIDIMRAGFDSLILDTLNRAETPEETGEEGPGALVGGDMIDQVIANYNMEARAGAKLIEEYHALKPYIKSSIPEEGKTDYGHSIIELKIGENSYGSDSVSTQTNKYLRKLRYKYWRVLTRNPGFTRALTSNILKELESKLNELQDYDFTLFNIRALERELTSKITLGIEESILKMFDDFSDKYRYCDSKNNVHYYNGWKTNSAYKINKKVILPVNGFSSYSDKRKIDDHYIKEKIGDMIKVFNYLSDEGVSNPYLLASGAINDANARGDFNVYCHFFDIVFYKKGTAHITFKNKKLLDKFNIYGSKRRGWLPPGYGKVSYEAMNEEARAVVDEFQGREEYNKVMIDSDYYLVEPTVLQLGGVM